MYKSLLIVAYISEGKELKDDVLSRETSSLTKAQAAAVKKRVDTLNATLRKKQKQKEKHKADVRDIFTPTQVMTCLVFCKWFKGAHRWGASQENRSLSLSYQKKDGRAWPHPSFFWYDTDFIEFESFDFIDHIL